MTMPQAGGCPTKRMVVQTPEALRWKLWDDHPNDCRNGCTLDMSLDEALAGRGPKVPSCVRRVPRLTDGNDFTYVPPTEVAGVAEKDQEEPAKGSERRGFELHSEARFDAYWSLFGGQHHTK